MKPHGFIKLGSRSFSYRVGVDGLPHVEGWQTTKLAVRTFRFARVRWGQAEAYVHTFEPEAAPAPRIPFFSGRRRARLIRHQEAS